MIVFQSPQKVYIVLGSYRQHRQSQYTYYPQAKVLGKVLPGFKNKYDLDIYDLR